MNIMTYMMVRMIIKILMMLTLLMMLVMTHDSIGTAMMTLIILLLMMIVDDATDATLGQHLIAQSACSDGRAVRRNGRLTESLEATQMLS